MKKYSIAALLILVMTFVSCSSDDSGSAVASGPKINTINEKVYYNGTLEGDNTFNFTYENGVLTKVLRGGTEANRIEFTYSGNKITTAKIYSGNVIESTNFFEYTGDFLASITNDEHLQKTAFNYSGDVMLSSASYSFYDNDWNQESSKTYSFVNKNIQQMILDYSGTESYKTGYEYDNSNNPFRNMNPYLRLYANFQSINVMTNNNITKEYAYPSVSSTTPALAANYVIVYNTANYPTSVKRYTADNVLLSEMTITYTE